MIDFLNSINYYLVIYLDQWTVKAKYLLKRTLDQTDGLTALDNGRPENVGRQPRSVKIRSPGLWPINGDAATSPEQRLWMAPQPMP